MKVSNLHPDSEAAKLYADLSKTWTPPATSPINAPAHMRIFGQRFSTDFLKQEYVLEDGTRVPVELVTITKTFSGLAQPRPEFSVPVVCTPRTVLKAPVDTRSAPEILEDIEAKIAAAESLSEVFKVATGYGPASANQPPSWLTQTLEGLWWSWRTRKQRVALASLPQRPWEGVSGEAAHGLPLVGGEGLVDPGPRPRPPSAHKGCSFGA